MAARRIARLLLPVAEAAGGFTSTQLLVRAPDEAVMWQPDVALVIGEAPADGQLREPPALVAVVDVGDATPILDVQQWLRLGVAVVWHVHEESVDVWTRSAMHGHGPGEVITLSDLPLPVAAGVRVSDVVGPRS